MSAMAAVLAAAAMLTGCADLADAQADAQAQQMAQEARAEFQRVGQECHTDFEDPAINPIRSRIAADDPQQATLAQMTDATKASDADLPAIDAYETARKKCESVSIIAVEKYLPAQASAAAREEVSSAGIVSMELYTGKITYGEFNSTRSKLMAKERSDIDDAIRAERARYAQERAAADADRRQRAANALAVFAAVAASRPQPVTTSCTRFGANSTCTTY